MKNIKIFVLINMILINFSQVSAQSYNAGAGLEKPSEFVFQTYKNQKLVSVRLLGAIKKAGVYHVPKSLKLTTLISLAGGTTIDADVEDILIGNETKGQSKKINLYDAIEKGSKASYAIKANDIIMVRRKKSFISNNSWKMLSVISVLLTGALTAIAINDKI